MSNRFDVIIIGAGPAGIACAEALAGSSLSVLLVEKNETGGPKICAGGLTRMAFDFGIPEDQARTFHIHTVHIDGRPPCRIVLTNPLKMVDRTSLGRYHLSKVEKAGNIELLTGARLAWIRAPS
jgi:flavin-dependent dehydrogenase